jgi:CHASE2 domain-containing sensor protein
MVLDGRIMKRRTLQKLVSVAAFLNPLKIFFALVKFWRRVPKRRLIRNIVAGVLIEIVLQSCGSSAGWRRDVDKAAMDGMIRLASHDTLFSPKPTTAFTFIDVNDKAYRHWDEPLLIPRSNLRKLIEFAANNGARAIVVDVDLSYPSLADQDQELASYLEAYAEPTASGGRVDPDAGSPPIILARTFKTLLDPRSEACRDARPSFLEQPGKSLSKYVHWASVKFEKEDDQIIRHWRLWERVCGEKKLAFIPSVQLMTVAFLKDSNDAFFNLETGFNQLEESCKNCLVGEQSGPENARCAWFDSGTKLNIGNWKLNVGGSRTSQRILYGIPWKPGGGGIGQLVDLPGGQAPILYHFEAERVLAAVPPPADAVKGRVVVIGASFAESRDIHGTPLGEMPGAMILINSIHSLSQYEELQPPSCMTEYGLLIVLLFLMSLLFAGSHHFWAMLVSGALVIFLLVPLSVWFFQHGRWLDYAIPLVVVQLHNMTAECEEALEVRKRRPREVQ